MRYLNLISDIQNEYDIQVQKLERVNKYIESYRLDSFFLTIDIMFCRMYKSGYINCNIINYIYQNL